MPREVYVAGDLHGCYHTFRKGLEKIGPAADDLIIPDGDIIDGGNHSRRLVHFCRDNANIKPNQGNHEKIWIDYSRGRIRYQDLSSVKQRTLEQFRNGNDKDLLGLEEAAQYFETFPLYQEFPEAIIVHAGVEFRDPLDLHLQDEKILLGFGIKRNNKVWTGKNKTGLPLWCAAYPAHAKFLFFGHVSIMRGVHCEWDIPYRTNLGPLDTKCARGGFLTIVRLSDFKYWRIPADKRDTR